MTVNVAKAVFGDLGDKWATKSILESRLAIAFLASQKAVLRAHNPEVVGSSPSPATKNGTLTFMVGVPFLLWKRFNQPTTDGFPE